MQYQLTHTDTIARHNPDGSTTSIPMDEANADYQAYLAWDAVPGNTPDPADPRPIEYAETRAVLAQVRTTDAAVLEVFRFPCEPQRRYRATLLISGVDAGDWASLDQEGRFVWKRPAATVPAPGITVVSQIPAAIPTGWATNCFAQGTDVVFTVKGPAGRTIDWKLEGHVEVYAPGGIGAEA